MSDQDIEKLVGEADPEPPVAAPTGNGGSQTVKVQFEAPPSRAWGSRNKTQTPTQAKAFTTIIAKMFPSQGEQLVVRKRQGEGANAKVEYVGIFRDQDLQGCPSVEAFLSRHIVPKFGYGAYPVAMLDRTGQESKHDEFVIASPLGDQTVPPRDATGVIATLLREVVLKDQQRPDMGLGGLASGYPQNNPQTYPQAQQGQHYPQQSYPQSGSDSVKDELVKKMIDRVEHLEKSLSAPKPVDVAELIERVALRLQPPPAPVITPPQFDWLQAASLIKDIVREFRAGERKEDGLDQFLKIKQVIGGERSAEVDILKEMLRDQKDRSNRLEDKIEQMTSAPPEDAVEKLKGMVEAVQVVREIGRETESKKDSLGAYLSEMFKQAPAVLDKASVLMDKAMQRDRQALQARALMAGKVRAVVTPVAKPKTEVEQAKADRPNTDPYPEGFDVYVDRLVKAGDPASKIRGTLEAFQFIGQHEPWKKYFDACLLLAKAKDKRAIDYVDAFLGVLYDRRNIPEELRLEVISLFKNHWDQIIDVVLASEPETTGATTSAN